MGMTGLTALKTMFGKYCKSNLACVSQGECTRSAYTALAPYRLDRPEPWTAERMPQGDMTGLPSCKIQTAL